uniref:Uncharacterized protein n=1 Tax=Sphaerodactylus townsendi TaxID=933632 RepID=A0ACB8E6H7_9SAUR
MRRAKEEGREPCACFTTAICDPLASSSSPSSLSSMPPPPRPHSPQLKGGNAADPEPAPVVAVASKPQMAMGDGTLADAQGQEGAAAPEDPKQAQTASAGLESAKGMDREKERRKKAWWQKEREQAVGHAVPEVVVQAREPAERLKREIRSGPPGRYNLWADKDFPMLPT